MFNLGAGEIALILLAALLLLGPKRLPELARGIGKFVREFRRQSEEVRTLVETEFYRMDQDVAVTTPEAVTPTPGAIAHTSVPATTAGAPDIESGPGASTGAAAVAAPGPSRVAVRPTGAAALGGAHETHLPGDSEAPHTPSSALATPTAPEDAPEEPDATVARAQVPPDERTG